MAYDTIVRTNSKGEDLTAPYVRYTRCRDGYTRHKTGGAFADDTAWANTAHVLPAASTSQQKGFGMEIPTLADGVYLVELYDQVGGTAANTDTFGGHTYLVMPTKQFKHRLTTMGQ